MFHSLIREMKISVDKSDKTFLFITFSQFNPLKYFLDNSPLCVEVDVHKDCTKHSSWNAKYTEY